jgi:hypothetical protein
LAYMMERHSSICWAPSSPLDLLWRVDSTIALTWE